MKALFSLILALGFAIVSVLGALFNFDSSTPAIISTIWLVSAIYYL